MSSDEENVTKKRVKKSTKNVVKKLWPNILITGTPGTGKSTLGLKLQEAIPDLKYINIGELAKEKKCLGEWDETYQCHELEEDPLLDELEDPIAEGGVILDHHVCDFFPERFFDIVFVLRTNNTTLHDRLKAREYTGKKLEDNLQCEIFQTVLDEAKESYPEEIVHELRSDEADDITRNVERIKLWLDQWKKDNS